MLLRQTTCLIFIVFELIPKVCAQETGGFLLMPRSLWNVGELVTLTFLLDDRKFPSLCTSSSSNTPQFLQNSFINCTVPNITTCPSTGYTSRALGCWCVNHTENYYTIEYNFNAHTSYNGLWTGDIPCQVGLAQPLKIRSLVSDRLEVTAAPTPPVNDQGIGGFFLNPKAEVNVGDRVTMTFLMDDRQYPSKCITPVSTNTPQFLRSQTKGGTGSPVCTVPDITTACPKDGFTSGALGCGCVNHTNNYWIMEYNFIADATATGYWTANIACLDDTYASVLTYITLVSDSLTVQSSTANSTLQGPKPLTCDSEGGYSAVKASKQSEAVCVCDKNREIGTCGPCTTSLWMGGYCTEREQVPSIIALVVILGVVLILNALYFSRGIHKQGLPLNKQELPLNKQGAENTHQKNSAVPDIIVHQDEPSGASSLESATDANEGSTGANRFLK